MKYFAFMISALSILSCGSKKAAVNAEAPRDQTSITLSDAQVKNAGITDTNKQLLINAINPIFSMLADRKSVV